MLSSAALLIAFTLTASDDVAAGNDVKVKTLSGETAAGQLASLSPEKAVLKTTLGDREFRREDLLSIEAAAASRAEKAAVWVDLVDGSTLVAVEYLVSAGKAQIELLGGLTIEIPARSVTSVRLRTQDAQLAQQWRAIVAAMATGDQIVQRKTSMRTVEDGDNEPKTVTETALDSLEGVVSDISPEVVKFDFGGEKIDVKREKIEGIVYFHPTKRNFPPPLCRLIDASGSQWYVKAIELRQSKLAVTSSAGIEFSLPMSAVVKLDFGVGNVLLLSELEPDNQTASFSLQPKGMTASFAELFKPGRNRRFGGSALTLKGAKEIKDSSKKLKDKYDEGLALHATTRVEYRVPEGFRWFRAAVGMDESVGEAAHFRFIVYGDNKELLSREFDAAGNYLPLDMELDISGVRRLSIAVDAGQGLEIGDQLNLCEARLTK